MTNYKPKPPNKSGETQCTVRWIVETPSGWIGAWDKSAFDDFAAECKQPEPFTERAKDLLLIFTMVIWVQLAVGIAGALLL